MFTADITPKYGRPNLESNNKYLQEKNMHLPEIYSYIVLKVLIVKIYCCMKWVKGPDSMATKVNPDLYVYIWEKYF